MASNINADNGVVSGSAGLKTSADSSGVLALQTNGTTAVTIDTSQNATFANSANLPNTFGFKNRIINGDMRIDQRNAGAAVTMTTTGVFPVDRWQCYEESDGVMTAQQVSDAPAGFLNSIKFTTTTADGSITGAERVYAIQVIEANNIIDLAWGTASAKTVTVSFWVKSSLTGTFGGSLRGTLNYPFSYTIISANTWEQKSVTIAGPTTGTWPTNNTGGITLAFAMGIGPVLSGGGGAWTTSNFIAPLGAVAVISTLNATFQVTGVQFEVGSTATSFDVRPYGTELQLCQRYFVSDTFYAQGYMTSGNDYSIMIQHPVTMRAGPTRTLGTQNFFVNVTSVVLGVTPSGNNLNNSRVYGRASSSGLVEYGYAYTLSAEL